jgi:hypothetical protein
MKLLHTVALAANALYALAEFNSQHPIAPRDSAWKVGQIVQTSSGPVQGHPSPNASEVSEYLGIPYAQPPVGHLRFQPPVTFNGTNTINASKFVSTAPRQPPSSLRLTERGTVLHGKQHLWRHHRY